MRLDELESNESKYFELKIKEDLAIARRECVQKFMTLRTEVLHKRQRNKGAESAWQFSVVRMLLCTKEDFKYVNYQNHWTYPIAREQILLRARAKISNVY